MSTATPMLCAHCGRPMQSFVQVGSFWYHPECAQSPYAAPQPAEQPEPSCGWAGCPHGAECVHAKQPEPGGLADAAEAECAALSAWNHSEYAINALDTVHPMFLTAFKLGFATTRKRSDEEVARIMSVVRSLMNDAAESARVGPAGFSSEAQLLAEVERLLKSEA